MNGAQAFSVPNGYISIARYISHELRTPLNAVSIGLQILTSDAKKSTDSEFNGMLEILTCIGGACDAAVEV